MTRIEGADFETTQQPLPTFTLSVLLAGRSRPWRDIGDGLRIPKGAENYGHRGAGILTPRDTAASWRVEGRHDCLVLSLPAGLADRLIPESGVALDAALCRLVDGIIRDPLIPSLTTELWNQDQDDLGTLASDHAVALILTRLLQKAQEKSQTRARRDLPAERLSPSALRRAKDFLAANIGGDPSLEEVASAAGLSPHHFLRGFKGSTGSTPFRWLEQRRMELACRLLSETEISLADLSLEVGFANQSHFTAAFRRNVGTTPGRWRRQSRI